MSEYSLQPVDPIIAATIERLRSKAHDRFLWPQIYTGNANNSYFTPYVDDGYVIVRVEHDWSFAVESYIAHPHLAVPVSVSLYDSIESVCNHADNLEDGEPAPSQKAINDIKALIQNAVIARDGKEIMNGDVVPYFGEISVTWRNGDSMLRATSFSDARRPRLDFGTAPEGGLGDYKFAVNPTGKLLAEKLAWLYPAE